MNNKSHVLLEKVVTYPVNGDYKCTITLSKGVVGGFRLSVRGLRHNLINIDSTEHYDDFKIGLANFNSKLLEMSCSS